jgi:hypothetical protein
MRDNDTIADDDNVRPLRHPARRIDEGSAYEGDGGSFLLLGKRGA